MSELESALAELIERETPSTVAPFVDIQRRALVRSRGRIVAVAAALALAAGAATVVAIDTWPEAAPVAGLPVDGPAPERITVDGQDLVLTGEAPLREAWIDRWDRSTLVVEAGPDHSDDSIGQCEPFTVVRVLAQDARTVRIGVYGYRWVAPVPSPGLRFCAERGGYMQHRLNLGAPVPGRVVLNGTAAVPVRDPAATLTAAYLPAGYGRPGELYWGSHLRGSPRGMQAMRTFPGTTVDDFVSVDLADPAAERELVALGGQPSVFGAADEFTVESRPSVRGHEGVVFTYGQVSASGPTMRCVRWRESAALAVVVCSRRPVGALPAAEILAVAEGLRPGA